MRPFWIVVAACLLTFSLDAVAQSDEANTPPLPEAGAADAVSFPPAPMGASFPVWLEPIEIAQAERQVRSYNEPILTFRIRPRSAVRLGASVGPVTMLRMTAEQGEVLIEAAFQGVERSHLVRRPIPLAYCTQGGAARDIVGNRRWLACFIDDDNDSRFDHWVDVACAASEVTGCSGVVRLSMLGIATGVRRLREPLPYEAVEEPPVFEMALVLDEGPNGLRLVSVDADRVSAGDRISRRAIDGMPAEGLRLSAFGAEVVLTPSAEGVRASMVQNIQRQPAYVQSTVSNMPRIQQRVIRIAE